MKNMKRFLSLMLAMMLCLGAFSMTALAVNPFTDVPTTEWYYSDIDHAYQMELINGKTPTLFMPNDYLTYAEAFKLAACRAAIWHTTATLPPTSSAPKWLPS